jgi:hypothetical protein
MSRRKGEVTARQNERDNPHIVELPLPSGGFRSQSDDISVASNRGEAGDGTTMSSTTSDSASPIRRTPTPSVNGLAASGCPTAERALRDSGKSVDSF